MITTRVTAGVISQSDSFPRSPAAGKLVAGAADQPAFTSIFFAAFCASGVFGSATFNTPFLKLASI